MIKKPRPIEDDLSIEEILAMELVPNFIVASNIKYDNTFDANYKNMKWNQLFVNEDELIHYTKIIDFDKFLKHGKGTDYIKSFIKILTGGGELSKAQLTQLKRISQEVYKYHQDLKYHPSLYN